VPAEGSLTSGAPSLAKVRPASSALAVGLVATGLLILAFVVRVLLTRRIPAPWIMGDELLYSDLARSFAEGGEIAIRGASVGVTSYGIYPILISPAWLADSTTTAYGLAKVINALLITLAAVPMFFWARRLMRSELALGVLALVLLLPAGSYAGTIMTENAAFPAVCLALFAIALALERPTILFQLAALGAVLLAVACRLQNVVFFVIVPVALALKLFLDWRAAETRFDLRRAVRPYLPTVLGIAGLVLAYVVYQVARGRSLSDGLGAYQAVTSADYSVRAVGRWVVMHAAEIGFAVALVPVSALIIMVGLACTRGFATTAAERAFLAVATASLVFVVQAGAFASQFIQRIEERNMIYVEPVLIVALGLWLGRGAPRPRRLTLAALLVPATLLTAIPFERLFNVSIFSDTPGLLPLFRISALVDGGTDGMRVLLALGALAVCLFVALAPTRLLVVGSLAGVALFLGVSTHMVVGSQRGQAVAARAAPGAVDSDWIDDRVPDDEQAGLLFTTQLSADGHPAWQTEFWNRSVEQVYYLGARDFGGFPGFDAAVDGSGRLVSSTGSGTTAPSVDYVVVPQGVQLAGTRLGADGRFALYRVSQPLRLAEGQEGVYSDGWTGPDAVYTRYAPGGRTVQVDLSRAGWPGPDVPGAVRVELVKGNRALASRSWVAHSGGATSFRFRAPPAPFSVRIHVAPTFSPSQFGLADTRQLGVQAGVTVAPR
jgi:hypothetical protein